MDIIYYMVKDMHFTLHDILNNLAYYEILYLVDKYSEEVKEKNKQQEEERDRMDSEMHKMRMQMNSKQTMGNANQTPMPMQMPKMPKF